MEVTRVQFDLLTDQDVQENSSLTVTEPKTLETHRFPAHDGFNSLRLGAGDDCLCTTCGLGARLCPGHFGDIELRTRIWHPWMMNKAIGVLRRVCAFCGTALARPQKASCDSCERPQPQYARHPLGIKAQLTSKASACLGADEKAWIKSFSATTAAAIFEASPFREECRGYTLRRVPVLPRPMRPSIAQHDGSTVRSRDQRTLALQEMLRCALSARPEKQRAADLQALFNSLLDSADGVKTSRRRATARSTKDTMYVL